METNIDLKKYRGNNSTLYTGRFQGEEARKELNLDEIDISDGKIIFIIPIGTTSFNPSFYLGLLFNSIEKLGDKKFESKYSFEFEEKDNEEIIKVLKANLEDGKRNAMNSIQDRNSFKRFFKSNDS